MDRWVSSSSPSSSFSGAAAPSSSPRCRFDAVWRACGRCGAAAAAAAGWALGALLTCVFAVVGSLVGIFIGACMGMSTESGMLRGAGVGAVSGAVFFIEAIESCIEIWRSSESGKYSILFELDIISSLFSGRIVWEKVSPALQRAVQSQTESTLYSVLLQHLKDITNNFCDERILGTGGFGVVYKGVLGDGTVIAVKKFVQLSSQEQFENEVNLLRKLEHTNIVRLVGFCYETQPLQKRHEGKFIFAWEIECLLCLEYLPRGSLDKYISDASSGLDWPTRFRIIEGISYGLQYLHEQSDGSIIHLDLKPGNILLDENMIPKITDFGLSRLFDKKQTIHTVITRGTLGYMPPEYLRGIITPMYDIFSLGVLIMEVITGHRDYPDDIRTLSSEFIELELQRWINVLQKEHGYTSLETDCQQIKRCIQIGLICVNPDRTRRPTMKKIIDMLQGLESVDWYISNELTSLSTHAS